MKLTDIQQTALIEIANGTVISPNPVRSPYKFLFDNRLIYIDHNPTRFALTNKGENCLKKVRTCKACGQDTLRIHAGINGSEIIHVECKNRELLESWNPDTKQYDYHEVNHCHIAGITMVKSDYDALSTESDFDHLAELYNIKLA